MAATFKKEKFGHLTVKHLALEYLHFSMCNISIGKYVHGVQLLTPVSAQYKKAEDQFCNTAIHTGCNRNDSEEHLTSCQPYNTTIKV